MIGKNKWIPKKPLKPTKVVAVWQHPTALNGRPDEHGNLIFICDIEQRVFAGQTHGVVGRRYVKAKDEMDAYMKASKGEYDNY